MKQCQAFCSSVSVLIVHPMSPFASRVFPNNKPSIVLVILDSNPLKPIRGLSMPVPDWDNSNCCFKISCHSSINKARKIHSLDISLQWCHNERDSISNHQPHDCLLTVYSDIDQRKHQSSSPLAFVQGIHWWPVNSPHKGPVTRKMFPFDDVIIFYIWISDNPVHWCMYASVKCILTDHIMVCILLSVMSYYLN